MHAEFTLSEIGTKRVLDISMLNSCTLYVCSQHSAVVLQRARMAVCDMMTYLTGVSSGVSVSLEGLAPQPDRGT